MNKITYLFGAGASRNALPIIKEIPDRIENLIKFLNGDEFVLDDKSTFADIHPKQEKSKREFQLEMIESLSWLKKESANHASIDTLAKKLYLKGELVALEKLKISLSIFFVFEQIKNKPDPRYDSFFAALIIRMPYLPVNVKILSWNYDSQFEVAFSDYTNNTDIHSNTIGLGVKAKCCNNYDKGIDKDFGIYKLNGTTNLNSDNGWNQHYFDSSFKALIDKDIVELVTKNFVFARFDNNKKSSLSFAWERENEDNGIVKKALDNTGDTDALVVIGYSFPFFNRQVDRKIIGNMTNLKRVYFQAPDADSIKERFQALRDDLTGLELICKLDVEQFLLPNEL